MQMEINMMENSKTTKSMVREHTHLVVDNMQETSMKVTGLKERDMDKEFILIAKQEEMQVKNMTENIKTIRNTGKESITLQMVVLMKVVGKRTNITDKELRHKEMVVHGLVSGIWE